MNFVEPIRDKVVVEDIYNDLKEKSERNALMFLLGIYTRTKNFRHFAV